MGLKARQPDAAGAERASERTGKIGRVFEDLRPPPLLEPNASTLTVLQWNVRSHGNRTFQFRCSPSSLQQ
jgi:hypothetical protein